METFLVAVLVAAYGAGFTGLCCWRVQVHHRRPGWHFALVGTSITMFTVMFLVAQDDLFNPKRWDDYKGGFWPNIMVPATAAGIVALLSSFAVVYYFRAKFKDVKPLA